MKRIKRIGIGYYELENGQLIDKKSYHLAEFLEEQRLKLEEAFPNIKNPNNCACWYCYGINKQRELPAK